MKRLLCITLIAFLFCTFNYGQNSAVVSDSSYIDLNNNIVFNDLIFEKFIKLCLKKDSDSKVNISEVEFLKNLNIPYIEHNTIGKIHDIDAIKYFRNLENFTVQFHAISSLRPLEKLVHLRWLHIHNNLVDDIGPLSNLVNLFGIVLSANRIKDISALKNLKQLKNIDLSCNYIEDISVLKELPELESINLVSNRVTDINCLKKLKRVESLWLSYNRLKNPEVVKKLNHSLMTLAISDCNISDILFLKNCKKLSELYVSNNKIKDLSFAKDLYDLNELIANSNKIENIEFLMQMIDKGAFASKSINSIYNIDLSNNKINYNFESNQKVKIYISNKVNSSKF